MKIEATMTKLCCFEKIRFYMKYIAKNEFVQILIARYCTLLLLNLRINIVISLSLENILIIHKKSFSFKKSGRSSDHLYQHNPYKLRKTLQSQTLHFRA